MGCELVCGSFSLGRMGMVEDLQTSLVLRDYEGNKFLLANMGENILFIFLREGLLIGEVDVVGYRCLGCR